MEFKEVMLALKNLCAENCTCQSCPLEGMCVSTHGPEHITDDDIDFIVREAQRFNFKYTLLDVIKKVLPNIQLNKNGIPDGCPHRYFGDSVDGKTFDCGLMECEDCWNRPAPKELLERMVVKYGNDHE